MPQTASSVGVEVFRPLQPSGPRESAHDHAPLASRGSLVLLSHSEISAPQEPGPSGRRRSMTFRTISQRACAPRAPAAAAAVRS